MTLPFRLLFGALLAARLATAALVFAAEPIELDNPRGGWRDGSREAQDAEVEAAYPRPPVDRGGQRHRTLIKGRLAAAGVNRRPPGLFIVNGNPMPLYTDEAGFFVKPWAFGRGSNSVEVRSPDGRHRKRVQLYETNARTPARLRAILGWDDGKAEVDMHVITPDGQHAFWARPVLATGGGLDVDSVDGGGPEIFSVAAPVRGTYLLYVNYWGNFDAAGYNFDRSRSDRPLITATVTVIVDENTLHEKRETWMVPLRNIGDLTLVRAVRY